MIIALSLLVTAAVYALGVRAAWRRAGRGRGISVRQVTCFGSGVAIIAIALLSPLDRMADDLFSAHMAQHVMLATLAPPFLVLGAPLPAVLWAFPSSARRHVWSILPHRVWRFVTSPVVATGMHLLAIWMWHARVLYESALRNEGLHAIEHVSFLGTGALLWWSIVHPRANRRTGYAVGMIVLFVTAMHTGVLGALITLSRHVWYPTQSAGAAAWGLSAMEDQTLAGLIMWVPGGFIYVAAMSVLFIRWLEPRRATRSIAAAAAIVSVSACSGSAAASVVPGGNVQRGKQAIEAMGCGACHTIDGVRSAHGEVGPPLSGIARRSILAGEVANTPENMVRWIENPQAIEPTVAMPNLGISPQSARDIAAYLYTLR